MADREGMVLVDLLRPRHDDCMRADLDHDNLLFTRDIAICLCASTSSRSSCCP